MAWCGVKSCIGGERVPRIWSKTFLLSTAWRFSAFSNYPTAYPKAKWLHDLGWCLVVRRQKKNHLMSS
jgi:hypothetical protein